MTTLRIHSFAFGFYMNFELCVLFLSKNLFYMWRNRYVFGASDICNKKRLLGGCTVTFSRGSNTSVLICKQIVCFTTLADYWVLIMFNRITTIRFRREQKTPALWDSYGRNSTERTVDPNTTIPQTSPPWWSHLPLLWHRIYGSAQSDAYNLFGTGCAWALGLSFIWNDKVTMVLIYFYYYPSIWHIVRPQSTMVAKAASIIVGSGQKHTNKLLTPIRLMFELFFSLYRP